MGSASLQAVTNLAAPLSSSRQLFCPPQKLPYVSTCGVQPLPELGSPAGHRGLRGCHAFCRKNKRQKSRQPFAVNRTCAFASFVVSRPKPPGSTRRRLAIAAQCPQPTPLRYVHCSHFPNACSKLFFLTLHYQ
jgi:hypothetical protein